MTRRLGSFAIAVLVLPVSLVGIPARIATGAPVLVSDTKVAWNSQVRARDGGFSAGYDANLDWVLDYSFWSHGDTFTRDPGPDGDRLAENTLAVTTDLDATNGVCLSGSPCAGFEFPTGGIPTEGIPLSPAEAYINQVMGCSDANRSDGDRCLFVWGDHVVADHGRNRVLFWFTGGERPQGPGAGDLNQYSKFRTGVAIWSEATGRLTRPESRPNNPAAGWDRYSLFDGNPGGEGLYSGSLVTWSGHLYATAPLGSGLATKCKMARAPLASAHLRSAWEFFAGVNASGQPIWSTNHTAAKPILSQASAAGHPCIAPHRTITYNWHLGKYLMIYGFGGSATAGTVAYYSTAPQPWGPWSSEQRLFTTQPAPGCTGGICIYHILEHPEYVRDGGRTIFVSYHRSLGDFTSEIRTARVRFD